MALLSLLTSSSVLQYFVIGLIFAAGAHVALYKLLRSNTAEKLPVDPRKALEADKPVSVNYFPSRECTYEYGFCFHTETSSYVLPIEDIKRGLCLLREAGMQKLNIAGGEPFLHPKLLTQKFRYCKEELGIESISIVRNGSKIQEKWMRDNAKWLDILAVSCDSFNPRQTSRPVVAATEPMRTDCSRLRSGASKYNVMFKLNTVVNTYNWDEDTVVNIKRLAPCRWEVFQCLTVASENDYETRKRDVRKFLVIDEQWRTFCNRHKELDCYIPEDNNSMASSYLLLDACMCFLDKVEGTMTQSMSILDVGVKKAMKEVKFDKKAFLDRKGIYWDQPKLQKGGCGGAGGNKDLDF
jgi:radical S-adenosyl methionine domain-containing protein 2